MGFKHLPFSKRRERWQLVHTSEKHDEISHLSGQKIKQAYSRRISISVAILGNLWVWVRKRICSHI